jgi:hypothetical protein
MPRLDRRTFLGLCSACAAFVTRTGRPQNLPKGVVNKKPVKSRQGVVLSTRYEEMWLANLTAAGDTLRETFTRSAV